MKTVSRLQVPKIWENLRLGRTTLRSFAADSVPPTPKPDPEYSDPFDDDEFTFVREKPPPRPASFPERTPSPFAAPDVAKARPRVARPKRDEGKDIAVSIQPRRDESDAPRFHPSHEPYEGGFISVDESPYRLREMFQVKELWRASLTHPGRAFENLIQHMRPLSLWQSLHAYLIGGKALQMIHASHRLRQRYEQQIQDVRNAVLTGRFMWRGKAGIFIQGEMRRGMEPRMFRSDVKEMETHIEAQRQKMEVEQLDVGRKLMLESFFQDRLVTEVLRVVLEPLFEPTFAESSHGFRPGRTQHSALKAVRRDFGDAVWIFRSDLRGLFELILENRKKFTAELRRRLEPRVKDDAFLELLFSGLNTRSVMSDYEINPPEEGYSPLNTKSGILPLLCNIYFDPLDQWIQQKSGEINRGKFRRVNPERAALVLRGIDEKVADEMLPLDPNDPVFRRLCYCRFADDFVFGLSGPQELALELKEEFEAFASEVLLFPLPKVELSHATFKTRFLGHTLRRRVIMPRRAVLEVRRTSKGRISREVDAEEVEVGGSTYQVPPPKEDPEEKAIQSQREVKDGPREILSIDGETDKIVRLFARAGYCHKNGDPQPNFKHLHFSQSETNQVLRRMLLSVCDLYRVARNRQRLVHYCSYILRHSVAKMYAAKFKLRSRAKVFKRGGAHLGERIQYGKGYVGNIDPDTGQTVQTFAELPYARIAEVPKPDLLPLPANWQPEMMIVVHEKLLGHVPRF